MACQNDKTNPMAGYLLNKMETILKSVRNDKEKTFKE
jgi:hypothetical protein